MNRTEVDATIREVVIGGPYTADTVSMALRAKGASQREVDAILADIESYPSWSIK